MMLRIRIIRLFRPIKMVLLLFAAVQINTLFASSLPDTLTRIKGGVVAVGTIIPVHHTASNRPRAKYAGTGFVVGSGKRVITNYHVIPETLDEKTKEELAIFVGRGKLAQARKARVIRSDPVHDLALLEIEGPALKPLQLEVGKSVIEGEEVAFTGFPLGMALGLYPVTHKTIIASITPVVMPAHTSKKLTAQQIKRLKTPYEVFQLDAIAYPGNSGSPVYRIDSGKVIGIVNSVFVKSTKESILETPSGISYAIPARYIHGILK
ncbi:MAG: serine protease [Sedimenticola sp.]